MILAFELGTLGWYGFRSPSRPDQTLAPQDDPGPHLDTKRAKSPQDDELHRVL